MKVLERGVLATTTKTSSGETTIFALNAGEMAHVQFMWAWNIGSAITARIELNYRPLYWESLGAGIDCVTGMATNADISTIGIQQAAGILEASSTTPTDGWVITPLPDVWELGDGEGITLFFTGSISAGRLQVVGTVYEL